MLILILLGMYFDTVVVFGTSHTLLLRLAVAILCILHILKTRIGILPKIKASYQYGLTLYFSNLRIASS